jgi:hypothetical protein
MMLPSKEHCSAYRGIAPVHDAAVQCDCSFLELVLKLVFFVKPAELQLELQGQLETFTDRCRLLVARTP